MEKTLFKKLFKSLKADKTTDAISDIDRLIKKNPSKPNNYIKKGDIYQKLGRNTEAIDAYQKAVDIYIDQGFSKTALAVYKLILRIDPGNKTAFKGSEKIISDLQLQEKTFAKASLPPVKKQVKQQQEEAVRREEAAKKEKVDIRYYEDVSKNTFLSPFNKKELETIFRKAKIRYFPAGEVVIREGDSGDSIFAIRQGNAEVVFTILGRNLLLDTLDSGDIFGEIAFFTGRERTASVIAKGNLIVLEFDRPLIEEMIELKPEIMEHMNETYHCRIKKTDERKHQSKDERFLEGLKKLKD
jgi:CRP-like cAMP-binding protein